MLFADIEKINGGRIIPRIDWNKLTDFNQSTIKTHHPNFTHKRQEKLEKLADKQEKYQDYKTRLCSNLNEKEQEIKKLKEIVDGYKPSLDRNRSLIKKIEVSLNRFVLERKEFANIESELKKLQKDRDAVVSHIRACENLIQETESKINKLQPFKQQIVEYKNRDVYQALDLIEQELDSLMQAIKQTSAIVRNEDVE